MAKSERAKAKATAWRWYSQYVRLMDCKQATGTYERGICITCGGEFLLSDLDAGHFIPGRSDAVLFELSNCHTQCRRCNRFRQGMFVEYEIALYHRYGYEEVDRLKQLKFKTVKYSVDDLRSIATDYRLKVNEIIKGLK